MYAWYIYFNLLYFAFGPVVLYFLYFLMPRYECKLHFSMWDLLNKFYAAAVSASTKGATHRGRNLAKHKGPKPKPNDKRPKPGGRTPKLECTRLTPRGRRPKTGCQRLKLGYTLVADAHLLFLWSNASIIDLPLYY